jgi:hypothetical protein
MWRLTKAIIFSWLVGVVCGIGMVIMVQRDNRAPLPSNTSTQSAPQTTGTAPVSPGRTTR